MTVINLAKEVPNEVSIKTKKQGDVQYGRDYFENGVALGLSMYENYRWLPELTMRMAHFLIKRLGIGEDQTVLDFGCAKGYLVKAFRLLGVEAYGCDISPYAIGMVDPDVKEFCRLSLREYSIPYPDEMYFDWIIAKDVFEHLEKECLQKVLDRAQRQCDRMFVVVPLGGDGRFVVPEYQKDVTHRLAKDATWWQQLYQAHGWDTAELQFQMTGLKENWAQRYPEGNGLFTLKRLGR